MGIRVNSKAFKKQIDKIASRLPEIIHATLKDAAETGAARARRDHKWKSRSPTGLESRITGFVTGPYTAKIVANSFYASWLEFGNGPLGSRIFPKRGKYLRFKSTKGQYAGQYIFVKSVKASRPRPFMAPVAKYEEKYLPRMLKRYLSQMIKASK